MYEREGRELSRQLTEEAAVASRPLPAIDPQPPRWLPAKLRYTTISDDRQRRFWSGRGLALPTTRVLALVDQAVVSGTSFLTTAMLARWAVPDELGIYAMAIALLVAWVAVQDSVVSLTRSAGTATGPFQQNMPVITWR